MSAGTRQAVFSAPLRVRSCAYEPWTRRLVLVCEGMCCVVSEEGRLLLARRCDGQRAVLYGRSLFVLHGPMVSMVALDAPPPLAPVLVSNFVSGRASLLAFSGDGGFMVSSTLLPRVLFSPQDESLPEASGHSPNTRCSLTDATRQYWIQAHGDVVTAVAAAQSESMYTGCRDGSIRKWATSGDRAAVQGDFAGHTSMVTALLLCRNDSVLVSASKDSTLRFWWTEPAAGTATKEAAVVSVSSEILLVREHEQTVFSAHDSGLIMGWLVLAGEQGAADVNREYWGHHGIVQDLAFQGDAMLSAAADGAVRVWSIAEGSCLRVLCTGSVGPLCGCFFDAKGMVCGVGADGSVTRWLLSEQDADQAVDADSEFAAPLLASLRATSSQLSRVVLWLDSFLEVAAGMRRMLSCSSLTQEPRRARSRCAARAKFVVVVVGGAAAAGGTHVRGIHGCGALSARDAAFGPASAGDGCPAVGRLQCQA